MFVISRLLNSSFPPTNGGIYDLHRISITGLFVVCRGVPLLATVLYLMSASIQSLCSSLNAQSAIPPNKQSPLYQTLSPVSHPHMNTVLDVSYNTCSFI